MSRVFCAVVPEQGERTIGVNLKVRNRYKASNDYV